MREEVYIKHSYPVGHRVDRQLLICLEDVFRQCNENYSIGIEAECTNSTKYSFSSIDECFDFFEKKPYRIIKMDSRQRNEEIQHDGGASRLF